MFLNISFGDIFFCDKNEVFSSAFIGFKVNNKKEAIYLISYLKCKIPNLLL